jgi:hypothetical protein
MGHGPGASRVGESPTSQWDARHSPLIEPDKRISRIRLFGKMSPQAHADEHSGNSSEQL